LCVFLSVSVCHGVSCSGGAGEVRSLASRQSRTICALIRTSPNTLKAFQHLASVKTLKTAYLKADRKPSLLIWKTCQRAKSLTRWKYLRFTGKKQTTEGEDLVFKALVLEILIKMALTTVQNEQPVHPTLRIFLCVSKCFNYLKLSVLLV
jgi:hypothetical protein